MIRIGNLRSEQRVVISMRVALHDAGIIFQKLVNRCGSLVYVKIENVVRPIFAADGDIY